MHLPCNFSFSAGRYQPALVIKPFPHVHCALRFVADYPAGCCKPGIQGVASLVRKGVIPRAIPNACVSLTFGITISRRQRLAAEVVAKELRAHASRWKRVRRRANTTFHTSILHQLGCARSANSLYSLHLQCPTRPAPAPASYVRPLPADPGDLVPAQVTQPLALQRVRVR